MKRSVYFDGAVSVVPSYVQPTAGFGLIVSMRITSGYCALNRESRRIYKQKHDAQKR
jgi:hypothetical protein